MAPSNSGRIRRGDLVWRTHDPDLDKLVRPYVEAATPLRKQPVAVHVDGARGRTAWSPSGASADVQVTVESETPLGAAQPIARSTREYLREQFGRLGNTPYELAACRAGDRRPPFAPSSLLNHMRREAVEQLAGSASPRHAPRKRSHAPPTRSRVR